MWNDKPDFDEGKDKSKFRDYESACDRVKAFYKEQHGLFYIVYISFQVFQRPFLRKTDGSF